MNSNPVCIILVAGHAQKLRKEIEEDLSGNYKALKGKPKALLPVDKGKCVLDYWWDAIKKRQLFSEVFLVTNADKYKHFERWATASNFPAENVINDGSTLTCNSLGALSDIELVMKTKMLQEYNVMIIAGDMLFQDSKFDIAQVLQYFKVKEEGDLAIYYEMDPSEDTKTRGIVEVCPQTKRILKFLEKPDSASTTSRFASVVFYCLRLETAKMIGDFIKNNSTPLPSFGSFLQWLINDKQVCMYGMKLPTGFQLIGDIGLADYEKWRCLMLKQNENGLSNKSIMKKSYARVGLMGNPSDGFYGKTISLSIENFWAEVTIEESATLRLLPHPLNDPTEFGSLSDLYGISSKEGYLGGLRLLQATCKRFYKYCSDRGIALGRRNFTLSYDTNIPRQVGLAGSSAIVTSTLKCLMAFFNLTDSDLPKHLQPNFILDVEKGELNINAGLQDRVVQVYEGLVYMDFSENVMKTQGFGNYKYIKAPNIPKMFLVYLSNPSDSGKIHSDVTLRFSRGDEDILSGMKELAHLTDEALKALENSDWKRLEELMNDNFAHRRRMYGDAALGAKNLRMIDVAHHFGAAIKFPGSGGAVLGMLDDPEKFNLMKEKYQCMGCVVVDIIPRLSNVEDS